MEDLISKKNLLIETDISYGQLYRWKRKGLIPESWFIRRSTFTGQETFFPRDAILERIRWIQDMKSDAALDALADKIRDPGQWEKRLPQDIVWGKAGLPIHGQTAKQHGEVTRLELFWEMVSLLLEQSGHPLAGQAVVPFLQSVPPSWLEYPDMVLYGQRAGEGWRFMIAQTDGVVWFGADRPDLSISLAQLWKEAKAVWEQASHGIHGG